MNVGAATKVPSRFGWLGFHREGYLALEAVLERGYPVVAVLTLDPAGAAKRSGAVDFAPLCEEFNVPLLKIDNINAPAVIKQLRGLSLDLLFVIGWSQVVGPEALDAVRFGMIGAHASLLPRYRGSAPINWALIKGEKKTGNTLIWLAEGVDSGDIIDQTVFDITLYDTCASLYDKVALSNRDMILKCLDRLRRGERPGEKQPAIEEPPLPRRRPADGIIDWNQPAPAVYDFIRALARPYPGAFGWLDGKKWMIWQAALLPGEPYPKARAGEVVGVLSSPNSDACGQVVKCETGAVILLELESEEGHRFAGYDLSDLEWKGRRWSSDE